MSTTTVHLQCLNYSMKFSSLPQVLCHKYALQRSASRPAQYNQTHSRGMTEVFICCFAPGSVQGIAIGLCLSVPCAYLKKTARQPPRIFLYTLPVAEAWFSSDDDIAYRVFPVWWKMSCLTQDNLPQNCVASICQGSLARLFDFVVVYDGSKLRATGRSLLSSTARFLC